jgi:hypothetical protein
MKGCYEMGRLQLNGIYIYLCKKEIEKEEWNLLMFM